MTCPELVDRRVKPTTVDTGPYRRLHNDGRRLIHGWFERAWKRRNCSAEESFEPFIFSWIGFNAWAACVTGLDDDHKWRRRLMLDPNICDNFGWLVKEKQSLVSEHSHEFRKLWPIFKVQELRRKHLRYQVSGVDRDKLVQYYLEAGVEAFQPKCWRRHRDSGEDVPLD